MPTFGGIGVGGSPQSSIGWDVATVSTGDGNLNVSWPAIPSASSYVLQINGGAPMNVGNVTSYAVAGLTEGGTYSVVVKGVDSTGLYSGGSSSKSITVRTWNLATGGTTTDVTNYNGTGQTWRVHTFSTSGTFTVTRAPQPFSYAIIGGGGGGGSHINFGGNPGAGGGGGGGQNINASATLSTGAISVTVGGGGGCGGGGGTSSLGALTASGGGAGGNCRDASNTYNGGGGTSSNITGTSITYGANGTKGGNQATGGQNTNPGGGGGGSPCGFGGDSCMGTSGTAGVVIVAYRVV